MDGNPIGRDGARALVRALGVSGGRKISMEGCSFQVRMLAHHSLPPTYLSGCLAGPVFVEHFLV